MASHIVIDARRIRDFGIGTYIRSLVQALGSIDRNNQYTLVSGPADVRTLAHGPRNGYFGIGTYIRSLVQALGSIDRNNQYTLVSGPADVRTLAGLPENFHSAVYTRDDHSALDHVAFPLFLRGLSPDLVHIPLARVPLLMIRPYVVTVHDMANIFFEEDTSNFRMHL